MNSDMGITEDVIGRARRIELVGFDVDGVLTNGSLFFGDDGQEYKAFNARDGHGLRMLHDHGIRTAIITGRTSQAVAHRADNLEIDMVYQGRHDKANALDELAQTTGLELSRIAYVGDDVIDLPVLCRVGLAIAVNDAHPLVVQHCHWQTPSPGGQGAGRDVSELLLKARGVYEAAMQKYIP